ncbi:hypothetical protein PILCRDRAFT_829795 [Piloderma croceum F 1598]|uniref:CFEM domain-containing protein n=1 Tax=Piloderma croceum (strain F 1598) TaxID=765440 RepID=A0A0C3EWG6_PILCF|nr:hypothetical protein PILCRDRAFT_829795 [Piloderma croceum F 1598]
MHTSFKFFVAITLTILGVNAQHSTTAQNSTARATSTHASGSRVSASGNVTATTTAPASTFSSADGYTPCITNCSISAASAANCSTYFDLHCVCLSSTFQNVANQCLQSNCSSAEQAQASQLMTRECAFVTAPGLSSTAGGATSTGAATSNVNFGCGGVFGAALALAGAVIGAGLTF